MLGRPCLVSQLGFMVVLMNNNVNFALLMLYLSLNKITCVNRNMENHPGKQCYHKTYGSVLAY
jgi:hypothetical protein